MFYSENLIRFQALSFPLRTLMQISFGSVDGPFPLNMNPFPLALKASTNKETVATFLTATTDDSLTFFLARKKKESDVIYPKSRGSVRLEQGTSKKEIEAKGSDQKVFELGS